MALPTVFANLSAGNQSAALLDGNFNALGAIATIPGTIAGTNVLALTPAAGAPTVAAYNQLQAYRGIATATSTGAITFSIGALPVLPVYQDLASGPTAAGAGAVIIGNSYDFIYDVALNSGIGGFHLVNVAAAPSVSPVVFSANKNAVNQTGIASATPTKLTFGTTVINTGSYYDTATSRFTPPSGTYQFNAAALFSAGVVDTFIYTIILYKNGSALFQGNTIQGASANQVAPLISVIAPANGTDFFELWAIGGGAGAKTVSGDITTTYFQAYQI